jgi:acyl-[acyl-carrier-protein]-phospholipid O-acyltransferase/long-chain-fatty-acid--[acyl-carrier-protein] ligase
VIVGLNLVCLLAALPARFPSDVYRPESPRTALRGFFGDTLRLFRFGPCRASLLAVCLLRGLVTIAAGALIADGLARRTTPASQYQMLVVIAVLTMLGAAAGSFLAGLIGDGRRTLGLVPLGATGVTLTLLGMLLTPLEPAWFCVLVGVGVGLINVPLLSTFQAAVPSDARGNGMAILNTGGFVSMTVLSLLVAGLAGAGLLTATGQLVFVTALSGLSACAAWWFLGSATTALLRSRRPDDRAASPERAA